MKLVTWNPDVLIADDDPTAIASITATLTEAGHAVATARNGLEALSQAGLLRPRLLILDVGMPDVDGFNVCRQLREDPATADLPILFLSARASLEARLKGLDAGGIDFLAKPFEPSELVARVKAQLSLVSRRERLADHNQALRQANTDLRSDLLAASRIQKAMLPKVDTLDTRIRFAWRCIQCDQLGGDAVNIIRLSKDQYAFYVLDASGHGAPASLLAVATGYFIAALYGETEAEGNQNTARSPAAVLNSANRVLERMMPEGTFVTIVCGIIDLANPSLTFATAGHPSPLLLRRDGTPTFLDLPAPPAGIGDWTYADQKVDLLNGDRFLLYSDGLYEQRNAVGDRLDRSKLVQWTAQSQRRSTQDAATYVMHSFEQWRGTRPMDDDLLLLAIDYVGDPS